MKSEPIREIGYRHHKIRVWYDTDNWSPREDQTLGIMVMKNRKYILPNEGDVDFGLYESWDSVMNALKKVGAKHIHRIIMYDHSGISLRASMNYEEEIEPWDSSVVGFIYTNDERIRREFPQLVNKNIKDEIDETLRKEVAQFGWYMNGEVYGYSIEFPNGDVEYTGVWYGYNGIDDAIEDAKNEIDRIVGDTLQPTYYVSMIDTRLSDAGYSSDHKNKIIIECHSINDAFMAYKNASKRKEMKGITLSTKVPSYKDKKSIERGMYSYVKGKIHVTILTENNGAESWFTDT